MSARLWSPPLDQMTLYVEAAFGADLTDTDGSGWTWTDITSDVRQTPGIGTKLGRGDEASRSQPAQLTLSLDNSSGDYALGGQSSHWPYIRRSTPVRVRIDPDDGGGPRVVFLGFADGWTPAWDAMGSIPIVQLSASGVLRRLRQGATPVISPFTRAMGALTTLVAYWPLEENDGATTIASGVTGGLGMSFSGAPDFGARTEFVSTARAMDAGTGAFQGVVGPYTATGTQQVRFLISIPDAGLADGTVLAHVHLTGTLGRVDVTYELAPGPALGWFAYNADGTLNTSSINGQPSLNGLTGRISIEITQSGSDVSWKVAIMDQAPGAGIVSNAPDVITSRTCGIIQMIELAPHSDLNGVGLGQITVENTITNLFTDATSLRSFYGELPATSAGRMARVCSENGVAFERLTSDLASPNSVVPDREAMAYQPIATLLEILAECEDADEGQLWDGLQPGLVMSTRRYRETGTVALELSAADGELAPPFAPVDDDQRAANSVTAGRKFGSSATYEDTTGALGVNAIGRYDTAVTINSSSDSMMLQHAAFRVALGTVEGYRVPTLTVDLRATPELAATILGLVPGDLVAVTDPADVLASFPVPDLRLLIEGISHDISARGWTATFTCSAAGPWVGAEAAAETGDTSERAMRADTDGATVATTAPRNSTSLSVATASGPLWTTNSDDFPLDLDVGGVKVTATACSGASSPQTFTTQALAYDRTAGTAVKVWDQRPLAL